MKLGECQKMFVRVSENCGQLVYSYSSFLFSTLIFNYIKMKMTEPQRTDCPCLKIIPRLLADSG